MKIISPSFKLYTYDGLLTQETGIKLLRWVEFNARISHRSEDAQTPDSWQKFLSAVVIGHGDWSVTEHAHVTAIFRVDRGVTHELVRHRLFSFTQESTRFVNYKKKGAIEVIRPFELEEGTFKEEIWKDSVAASCSNYICMLDNGARPQEARSVLPNALAATISVTGNLRTWRWFFLARTTAETHPDFRAVTIPMLEVFKLHIPLLYDDIQPLQKQSISMAKTH